MKLFKMLHIICLAPAGADHYFGPSDRRPKLGRSIKIECVRAYSNMYSVTSGISLALNVIKYMVSFS